MVAVAAALFASCGGSDSPSAIDGTVTAADLAGVWEASQFRMTSKENSLLQFDMIQLGGAMNFAIQPQGSFTGTVFIPAAISADQTGYTVPLSGVMRITNEAANLRIDFVPEIPPLFTAMEPSLELIDNTLTITDGTVSFDFDRNGSDEPADFQAVFTRN
jgi:hypothetical protein